MKDGNCLPEYHSSLFQTWNEPQLHVDATVIIIKVYILMSTSKFLGTNENNAAQTGIFIILLARTSWDIQLIMVSVFQNQQTDQKK